MQSLRIYKQRHEVIWAFLVVALGMEISSTPVRAGGSLQLVPSAAPPYAPGQVISVEVFLNNQDAVTYVLPFIRLDYAASAAQLNLSASSYNYDFSSLTNGSNYFTNGPGTLWEALYITLTESPGFILTLPASGQRRLGSIPSLTLPMTSGSYLLNVSNASAADLNIGGRVDVNFCLATTWRTFSGELTGGTLTLVVESGGCGNGTTEGAEECDDGNMVDGDCCSSVCAFETIGTNCRAAVGACDLDEFCDGAGNCPADVKSTAECRAAAAVCDLAEACDGVDNNCPADLLSTSECRGSTGPCDPTEQCDGINMDCPSDLITTDCIDADGCCAMGCNNNNDDDCAVICGNGVPESGEGCDDGNKIPGDGCSSNCDVEPEDPVADPSGIDKTRFISLFIPSPAPVTAGPGATALRVRLSMLHHVIPPYTGGESVPFTSFEFGANCEEAGGCIRWVGPPVQYVESTSNATTFYAASLQCVPHYQDWNTVGLVHVYGSAIVPSSVYEVENVAASCAGIEASCTAVSAPLTVGTTRWGDVAIPYNPPSPTTQPDVGDFAALVAKFRSASGAPTKARALLAGGDSFGNIQSLQLDFGFVHIAACVDAFRGKPYPYLIAACP